MKLKVERHALLIMPETTQDEAYLEEVLGLGAANAQCLARRVNAMGLSAFAYVELSKAKFERAVAVAPEAERDRA